MCQGCGEADAEWKVREYAVGAVPAPYRDRPGNTIWWRYLCPACLESEYGPWLRAMKR